MSKSGNPIPDRDHFDGTRFFNPHAPDDVTPGDLWRLLRSPRATWPRSVPVTQVVPTPPRDGDLAVTSIGHAAFLLQTADTVMLTDPVFSEYASPIPFAGPRRVRRPGVALEDLPPIDLVLLSHNHYDHCDAAAIRRLVKRCAPRFVTPLGNGPLLRSFGAIDVTELDWWDRAEVGGVDITLTPAQHFSARTPFDRNRALWGGFVVATGGYRVFFAGDSGYGPHFDEIGSRLAPIDLGLIPIGAYEPRWFMKPIHMNPEEAVRAHLDVGARRSVAMHHGVFRLTLEPIDEPVERLAVAAASARLPADAFTALEPGHSLTLTTTG